MAATQFKFKMAALQPRTDQTHSIGRKLLADAGHRNNSAHINIYRHVNRILCTVLRVVVVRLDKKRIIDRTGFFQSWNRCHFLIGN